MRHPKHHIFSMGEEALRAWCNEHGMPGFRSSQIAGWVFDKAIADPMAWSNLAARDREFVRKSLTIVSGRTVSHQRASDGTQKLLIEWDDEQPASAAGLPIVGQAGRVDRQTECVMIPSLDPESNRRTACISSQVGCPVGCRFCASGLSGLDGNLSAGRIVEQVWRLEQLPGVGRISNVVFMGMGEPLSNFNAVTNAIRVLATPKPWGMGIGARKITVSTVGLPQYINRLADQFDLPVTLALSLHATTDDLRRQLIPWAEYTTISELFDACTAWFEKTGREITLEYTLLGGTNDGPAQAHELASLAKSLRANVNLIRYNEVDDLPFKRPADADVRTFQNILRNRNVNAHIRASRGRDIAAACGQLRHEHAGEQA
ncbi:MAG: 23S rRNA (adenine(2503)-C(2))-methyltransferase RlmN [Planctomycetota bacterium]